VPQQLSAPESICLGLSISVRNGPVLSRANRDRMAIAGFLQTAPALVYPSKEA
jgi:hypothetical protein